MEESKSLISVWARVIAGWPALLLAGIAFLMGISYFSIPSQEVHFSAGMPRYSCHPREVDAPCLNAFTLEIGNTGKDDIPAVDLIFNSQIVNDAVMGPQVRNFGISKRKVKITDNGEDYIVALGRLKVQKRVKVTIMIDSRKLGFDPEWDDVLLKISSPGTKVKQGSPAIKTFMRVIYGIFMFFI